MDLRRKIGWLVVVTIFMGAEATAGAQALPGTLGGSPALPGAVGVAAAAKACINHPLLCSAVAIVGIGVAGKLARSKAKTDETCPEGMVPLYRVVEKVEHVEISRLQRYVILPTGMAQKQFWIAISDADWFASAMTGLAGIGTPTARFLVSSRACKTTVQKGYRFSDVGHQAVSFGSDTLPLVNRDAAASGGIITLKAYQ